MSDTPVGSKLDLSQFEGHTGFIGIERLSTGHLTGIRPDGGWMDFNEADMKLLAAAPQLLEELRELRADKARLDWLVAEFAKHPNSNGVELLDWGTEDEGRWQIHSNDFNVRGPSLRDAIDAAISKVGGVAE